MDSYTEIIIWGYNAIHSNASHEEYQFPITFVIDNA